STITKSARVRNSARTRGRVGRSSTVPASGPAGRTDSPGTGVGRSSAARVARPSTTPARPSPSPRPKYSCARDRAGSAQTSATPRSTRWSGLAGAAGSEAGVMTSAAGTPAAAPVLAGVPGLAAGLAAGVALVLAAGVAPVLAAAVGPPLAGSAWPAGDADRN